MLCLPSPLSIGIWDIFPHYSSFLQEHINTGAEAVKPPEHSTAVVTLAARHQVQRRALSHIKCLNHVTALARDEVKLLSEK